MKRTSFDRETVIAGLKCMADGCMDVCGSVYGCAKEVAKDALLLLQEQRNIVHCADCLHFRNDGIPENGCGYCELLSRTYEGRHYCADGVKAI